MAVIASQASTVHTLPELLAFRVAQSPQSEAYREFNAKTGQWVSTRWAAFSERVTQWRQALAAMQLSPHASIAILLPNGLNAVSLHQAALARIALQAKDFARHTTPRAVWLTLEPWTIENTLITPTLKLKRNNLMKRYAREIDAMYPAGARKASRPHKPGWMSLTGRRSIHCSTTLRAACPHRGKT